ncbi:post-transcriptional regulator [Aneurinibacillus tyrosinisolvens]|uniref:post-transcriptional regulator n=1 Tax=Aneurinibacillus tyrosinisolvens TaxID=1443435 RepID=UPI00063F2A37|nr:post-transcriptional regulator [Aneurinibacillus tyrosinisolvens]
MQKSALDAEILYLCRLKAQELSALGYEEIAEEEIWRCVSEKYKEIPALHKVVNDILSLKPGRFMNWMTMQAFKGNLPD